MNRVMYGWYDGYEPFQVAVMLLGMSVVAESQALVRRGAAITSRRLGRLYGRPEDFEAAARALEAASASIAVGGRRMRQLAERLDRGWVADAVAGVGSPFTGAGRYAGRGGRATATQVELAGYYVVAEALTNATKHARASAVNVSVESDDAVLRVRVSDDGTVGADLTGGTELVGSRTGSKPSVAASCCTARRVPVPACTHNSRWQPRDGSRTRWVWVRSQVVQPVANHSRSWNVRGT